MPRSRAKLSDKQERILIQAQLMGLTPHDMQQISNRLIALKKEAENIQEIGETVQGFSWSRDDKKNWVVTTPDGYRCEFVKGKTGKTNYWDSNWNYDVVVTKPGTAFKTRRLQKKVITLQHEWRAKLCPEGSKELYGMIVWAKRQLRWEIQK